jgi:hypothetical protein
MIGGGKGSRDESRQLAVMFFGVSFSSIGLHDEYSQFKRQWGIDADWHDLYGGDGRHDGPD